MKNRFSNFVVMLLAVGAWLMWKVFSFLNWRQYLLIITSIGFAAISIGVGFFLDNTFENIPSDEIKGFINLYFLIVWLVSFVGWVYVNRGIFKEWADKQDEHLKEFDGT